MPDKSVRNQETDESEVEEEERRGALDRYIRLLKRRSSLNNGERAKNGHSFLQMHTASPSFARRNIDERSFLSTDAHRLAILCSSKHLSGN